MTPTDLLIPGAMLVAIGLAWPIGRLFALQRARRHERRLFVWMGLAALLLAVLSIFHANPTVASIDTAVGVTVAWLRDRSMMHFFRWITRLGDSATLTAIVVVATGFLLAARHRHEAVIIWIVFVGVEISVWSLKFAVAAPSPDLYDPLDTVLSPSYPSAHAAGSLAVYGLVAWLLMRRTTSIPVQFNLAFGIALLVGIISLSRIVLAVHTVSDIAAGLLLGFFWLAFAMVAADRFGETCEVPPNP
jgi:membrane-associated phospholipid phosphatase